MSRPDEQTAYAIATWSRFNDAVPEDLLGALCGAFVLVAAADGELSQSEVDRFLQVLQSQSEVFSGVDFLHLETRFRDLAEALLSDPTEGTRLAIERVAKVRTDQERAELVHSAAKIAIAADDRVRPAEGIALIKIQKALGFDP